MSRASLGAKLAQMESLFAVERELLPEPDEIRNRVVRRAQESLPRTLSVHPVAHSATPRRVKVAWAAAAAVLLSTLCAVAFHSGYQMKSRSAAAPAIAPVPVHSVVVLTVPMTPSVASLPTEPKPPQAEPSAEKTKPVGPEKSAADVYAIELRVLQPAQRAVARKDFASALAAVAEHQRRFPSGRLAEEREALRVRALLGLGRSGDAQRAGVAFRRRFPRSALRQRMDKMLRTEQ